MHVAVTGASSGFGEAIARSLAAHGATVALVARRRDRLEQLACDIEERAGAALAIGADITQRSEAVAAVQETVDRGVETIVGLTQDPSFGPLVLFGLGGVTAELLADRALRTVPITDEDARRLVRSLRGSPLLFGYRGRPAVDVDALEDLVLRVGRLADELPEVSEMDLNPVVVSETGALAVDLKIRCAPAPDRVPPDYRRMRA